MKKQITLRQKRVIVIGSLLLFSVIIVVAVLWGNKELDEKEHKLREVANLNHVRLENNEKVNIADNVQEEKNLDNLVFSKQVLKNRDGQTTFELKVINQSEEDFLGQEIYICFLDDNGLELGIVRAYVPPLAEQEQIHLNISSEFDYSNVADYEIILDYLDS